MQQSWGLGHLSIPARHPSLVLFSAPVSLCRVHSVLFFPAPASPHSLFLLPFYAAGHLTPTLPSLWPQTCLVSSSNQLTQSPRSQTLQLVLPISLLQGLMANLGVGLCPPGPGR